jgi:hypothetical protein
MSVSMRALGVPLLHVQLATPDERALPPHSNARLLTEALRHDYPADFLIPCAPACFALATVDDRRHP